MATKTTLNEETIKKVIRQVEFYFSDSNLPRDNFLRNTISESEDGMVSLALICSFSRMRTHLSLGDVKADGVPEDTVKAVADTLRTSDFLNISEDGSKVGRKTELAKPEDIIEQVDSRTVAASPLPYDVKLEDVESFFGQFGKVNSVRLPKHVSNKNILCGTALVEFSTEEDAEKLLKQTLSFAGLDLELSPKKEFDAEREKQAEEFGKTHVNGNHKASDETSYQKGLIIAFKLKSKSSEDDSKQNGALENAIEVEASKIDGKPEEASESSENTKNGSEENKEAANDGSTTDKEVKEAENVENPSEGADKKDGEKEADKKDGEKEADKKDGEKEADKKDGEKEADKKDGEKEADKKDGEKAEERKTTSESFKNNMDVILREDLKALFEKFGKVKFIDFKMGDESGYIRFEEPEASQKARAAAVLNEEGGLLVKNYILTLEPVSGDAEKAYWKQIEDNQKAHYKGLRGRGGRFQRGGGGRGRHGRSRDNDRSPAGRPNKVQRVAT